MYNTNLQICSNNLGHHLELIPDEQISLSIIGSGRSKRKLTRKSKGKGNVIIHANKRNLKQILKQLVNSRNKIIINIIVAINNSQNINSPGALSAANQGISQQTRA